MLTFLHRILISLVHTHAGRTQGKFTWAAKNGAHFCLYKVEPFFLACDLRRYIPKCVARYHTPNLLFSLPRLHPYECQLG
jgi:hypothetical protein